MEKSVTYYIVVRSWFGWLPILLRLLKVSSLIEKECRKNVVLVQFVPIQNSFSILSLHLVRELNEHTSLRIRHTLYEKS